MKNGFEKIIPRNMGEYLEHFNRMDYAEAFRRYMSDSLPTAVGLAGSGEPTALAAELVGYMDSRVTGLWKKRRVCDMKYFLMVYTVPMLLEEGSAQCGAFASAIHDCWADRHPDNDFGMAGFGELSSGFNNTVLGFSIPGGGRK